LPGSQCGVRCPDNHPREEASHQKNSKDHTPEEEPFFCFFGDSAQNLSIDNSIIDGTDDLEEDESDDDKEIGHMRILRKSAKYQCTFEK